MKKFFGKYWFYLKRLCKTPICWILLIGMVAIANRPLLGKLIVGVILVAIIPIFAIFRERADRTLSNKKEK